MCGIVAVLGDYRYDKIPDSIIERGPDDQGIYEDENAQLIQTRLQITGKDKIPIPLQYENLVLLFNGQIYNYKELNKKYLYMYDFKYDSDFETVLYGYHKYGPDFFTFLDGQYAIFIYNKSTGYHITAFDTFRIRALYYLKYENSLIYSSNERALPEMKFNEIPNTGYGPITNSSIL